MRASTSSCQVSPWAPTLSAGLLSWGRPSRDSWAWVLALQPFLGILTWASLSENGVKILALPSSQRLWPEHAHT